MSSDVISDQQAQEIEFRVRNVIAKCQGLPVEAVTDVKTFGELDIDSLCSLDIAFHLEDEFHIDIPDEALESIQSVRGAIDGVMQLLQNVSVGE